MEWVKLSASYYRDPKVMALDADAELLFVRGLAYAGEQETHGFVPESVLQALSRTRKYAKNVADLERQGLWEKASSGWRIVRWDDYQHELELLSVRRAKDRERQRRKRATERSVVAGQNAVT